MKSKLTLNFPSGVISNNHLSALATIIYRSESKGAFLTNRQQVVINKIRENDIYVQNLKKQIPLFWGDEVLPNIVTTNHTGGLFNKNDWAYSQDAYLEILQSFGKTSSLSIGLSSYNQNFENIFSSHINFIVSDTENFWLLVLQKDYQLFFAPFLLDSSCLAQVSSLIEESWQKNTDEIFEQILAKFNTNINFYKEIKLPQLRYDIAEGFIKMNDYEYALNIYSCRQIWRADFLENLNLLMKKHNLRRLYITGRQSLLIKHIPQESLSQWRNLLAFYSVHIRHSENDLLWQYPQENTQICQLVTKLNKGLKKQKVSLHNFFIYLEDESEQGYFSDADLVILITSKFGLQSYNLAYKKDSFRRVIKNLNFSELLKNIIELSRQNIYSKKEGSSFKIYGELKQENNLQIYECQDCLTCYDENYGEPKLGIAPKTLFRDLSASWKCELCGNLKDKFIKISNS